VLIIFAPSSRHFTSSFSLFCLRHLDFYDCATSFTELFHNTNVLFGFFPAATAASYRHDLEKEALKGGRLLE
jgi:hypothetical protein